MMAGGRGKSQQAKKNLWKPEEDLILRRYVETHGEGKWASVSKLSGLMRGGKSCRLRWKNYLRPNIKRGEMSKEEEDIIIRMHRLIGNRWSLIAGRLPGRTDNEVKNYWNTHLNKNCRGGNRKSCSQSNTLCKQEKEAVARESKKKKEAHQPCYSHLVISSAIPEQDTHATQNKEEQAEGDHFSVATPYWDNTLTFDGCLEYPMLSPENVTLWSDDDPFTPYLDSFILF